MDKIKFRIIIAGLLALIMAAAFTAGCRLSPEQDAEGSESPEVSVEPADTIEPVLTPWPGNEEADGSTVVMRCGDVEFNLYDYGQAFYNGTYIQYYMYGLMTPDQYCDSVIEELSGLMYMIRAAKDNGVTVTDEEKAEIAESVDDYIEQVLVNYQDFVEEDVEDIEAAALALLEEDLAADGLDLDSFRVLAANNLCLHKYAEKYYNELNESVSVSDDDVRTYLEEKLETAAEMSMSDFVADMDGYYEGDSPYPVYVVDDCFSVNHIYMAFESSFDENGNNVYDTASRREDEAELESRFADTADYAAFMELENEYGEDPGMDSEMYRENGYLIHGDLVNDYFAGFVYAAMNLHEGSWATPVAEGEEPVADPELTFFELQDGTKVVKVYTESGVHYIIVNKELKKGAVEYTVGDEHWESWRKAASETRLNDLYEQLMDEWTAKYEIEVDSYTIKAHFPPAEDTGEGDK